MELGSFIEIAAPSSSPCSQPTPRLKACIRRLLIARPSSRQRDTGSSFGEDACGTIATMVEKQDDFDHLATSLREVADDLELLVAKIRDGGDPEGAEAALRKAQGVGILARCTPARSPTALRSSGWDSPTSA